MPFSSSQISIHVWNQRTDEFYVNYFHLNKESTQLSTVNVFLTENIKNVQ